MNLTISHTPTQDQIEEIKAWLIEEQNNSGEGFYCNWSIIASFYKRWNFSVISTNNKTIGFACWRNTSDLSGQINIFEIHPDFRRRGVGLYFTEKLLSHFVEKNVYVIDLQCVPSTSEIFWRYLGFTDVPLNIRYWDKQTQHLFKRLVPYQEESVVDGSSNYIEIWDSEPFATQNKKPKWRWDVITDAKLNKLKLPIIQPCEKDWRIRWIKNGRTIVDDKIKRFGNVEIDYSPYAIITELPTTG